MRGALLFIAISAVTLTPCFSCTVPYFAGRPGMTLDSCMVPRAVTASRASCWPHRREVRHVTARVSPFVRPCTMSFYHSILGFKNCFAYESAVSSDDRLAPDVIQTSSPLIIHHEVRRGENRNQTSAAALTSIPSSNCPAQRINSSY